MGRTRIPVLGFRVARALLNQVLIPLLMHSGPLEPLALRLFRSLSDRLPTMEGLPCPIRLDGLTLWYDTDRPSITVRGLAAGSYEQPIADLFATTLRPGMAVLDIGAHIGYFSLVASRHVGPTGHIWSFEPDPVNRASLERNVEANEVADLVTVVPYAVASAGGECVLYRVAGDTGSSTVYPRGQSGGERVAVTSTSLDAWAESEGWPAVDLVKVDAEGAEGAVLAGMTQLIERNPGVVLVLEFQADALEAAGESPMAFLSSLMAVGAGGVELLDYRGTRPLNEYASLAGLVRRSRWSPLNLAVRDVGPSGASSR
jgi:FkbM family methyltransferase